MSILQDCEAHATLPVSDMNRAMTWYREKLGLTPKEEDANGAYYETGGARWALFPTPYAGTAKNTQMEWRVKDARAVVAELKSKGVTFETFEMEGIEWDGDVATMGGYRGAWFKDSEGNTLAIGEETPAS
jgi:catechol 2,3-dioxygenase-like lactoylglutathione lyase family enzyme